jgi:hypothetical protein
MQADIRDALCDKYGAETDFPSWTKPFLHAVGIMNKLADLEGELGDRGDVSDEPYQSVERDAASEASGSGEEEDLDAGSDDDSEPLSVSCQHLASVI